MGCPDGRPVRPFTGLAGLSSARKNVEACRGLADGHGRGTMKSTGILALTLLLLLPACGDSADAKLKPVDNKGVPLDRGKDECKAQAKMEAQGLAKGDTVNGIADDLYTDCLARRGYFKD
jgi:hypothetical protein